MEGMEDKCRVAQHSTGYLAGGRHVALCVSGKEIVAVRFLSGNTLPEWRCAALWSTVLMAVGGTLDEHGNKLALLQE